MAAKPGYKGRCKFGATAIAGMVTWTYTGESRAVEDDSEFGDTIKTFIPLQIEGGEVTLTGNFLADTDAGQQALRTYFVAGTEITDLRLYINEIGVLYFTPDSTTTPASFATITKVQDMALNSKSGLMTITCTMKISGMLKINTSSTEVGVDTIGAHDPGITTVEAIGEVTGMGGEGSLSCYFEYGTTTSYGSDTSGAPDAMTDVGLFHKQITGLTTTTTYHFRAVAKKVDTTKHYGKDKTFITI